MLAYELLTSSNNVFEVTCDLSFKPHLMSCDIFMKKLHKIVFLGVYFLSLKSYDDRTISYCLNNLTSIPVKFIIQISDTIMFIFRKTYYEQKCRSICDALPH